MGKTIKINEFNILNKFLGKELTYVENNSPVPLVQELSMKQEATSFM